MQSGNQFTLGSRYRQNRATASRLRVPAAARVANYPRQARIAGTSSTRIDSIHLVMMVVMMIVIVELHRDGAAGL